MNVPRALLGDSRVLADRLDTNGWLCHSHCDVCQVMYVSMLLLLFICGTKE